LIDLIYENDVAQIPAATAGWRLQFLAVQALWPRVHEFWSFGDATMLGWLKRKTSESQQKGWQRVQQAPGAAFPFPRGAKLRPDEDVMLALPSALITTDETIGSVLLCDDDAEITLNDQVGAWYIKLKAGMTFSLAKSCEVMLIAGDSRPRFFHYLSPDKISTEQGAADNRPRP
jgi:hypothetical protein